MTHQDKTCLNPFEEFRCNVHLYTTCCPSWLSPDVIYGEWNGYNTPSLKASPWEAWNNQAFQQLRKAILDNDFKFCTNCAKFSANHLESIKLIEPWMKPILEVPPKRLLLEHDKHCNLKCPSCRSMMLLHEYRQDERDIKVKEICEEFMPTALWFTVMTSGEPLVSKSTLELIPWVKKYPKLEMELFTNGLLLPNKWHLIPEEQLTKLTISIDAATKETYENVRRPGKWEKLMQSLQFIKKKRKDGLITHFQINFVIQTANFHEIPKFVQLAIDHDTTNCFFTPILRVYHTVEDFNPLDISNSAHPRHEELLKVLKDPILKQSIVYCQI